MDKAICPVCVNGGLLCVYVCEKRDIVPLEREAYKILRIGLDETFGDGIILSHIGCLWSEVVLYDTRNTQTTSKYRTKKRHHRKN